MIAKMGLAQISYSYEYLGVNTGQFVRTQLADECFLILTQVCLIGSLNCYYLSITINLKVIGSYSYPDIKT